MNRTLMLAIIVLTMGCTTNAPPPPVASSTKPVEHAHAPSEHGGTLVSLGKDQYHVEAVFEQGGKLRLYLLGADETKVIDAESHVVAAHVKIGGVRETIPFDLAPSPQPGDAAGRASQFVGAVPPAALGKPMLVTIPNLRINGDRFRLAFNAGDTHPEPAMPIKLGTAEEQKLFLTAGGIYTDSDIKTNGSTIPTIKYKGIRAEHDDRPKPGDKLCPISKTKASPKFTWTIAGKSYEFCCVPCIEEFVDMAKEKPSEIKDPAEYQKK